MFRHYFRFHTLSFDDFHYVDAFAIFGAATLHNNVGIPLSHNNVTPVTPCLLPLSASPLSITFRCRRHISIFIFITLIDTFSSLIRLFAKMASIDVTLDAAIAAVFRQPLARYLRADAAMLIAFSAAYFLSDYC